MAINSIWRSASKETLVSVIIPVYNAEKYLVKAIESVLNQKKVRVEVIAINDASTDSSLEKLQKLSSTWGSILQIVDLKNNIGQARARNIGIDRATGDYLTFLDADDYYNGEFVLKKWSDAAKKNTSDITYSDFNRVNDKSAPLPSPRLLGDGIAGTVTLSECPGLVNSQACWQFLYDRKFLNENKLRFSEKLRQREDRLFFVKCLLSANHIEVTRIKTVAYRYHLESTMRQVTWQQFEYYVQHIRELCDFLENQYRGNVANDAFLKANALSYLRSLTRYWAPILSMPEACNSKLFAESAHALERLLRGHTDFRFESNLRLSDPDNRLKLGYFFDLVAEMIRNQDIEGLATCIREKAVHIRDFEPRIAQAVNQDRTASLLSKRLEFAATMTPAKPYKSISIMTLRRFDTFAEKNDLQFIFHLGYPKTGSSAVQEVIGLNRVKLFEEGIWFPVAGIERGANYRIHRNSGHAKLITSILEGKIDQIAKFQEEIMSLGQCKTVVVSSESVLSPRFWKDSSVLDAISDIFGDRISKVIAYMRRQDEWLESFYNELASNPGKTDMVDTPEEFFNAVHGKGLLNFPYVEDRMKQSFPTANLRLLSYEEESKGGNLVNNFLDEIGASPEARQTPDGRINESEGKITARLFVEANRSGMSANSKLDLARKMAERGVTCPKDAMHYDSDLRQTIMDLLQPTNQAFMSRHNGFDSLSGPVRPALTRVEDTDWRTHLDLIEKL